MKKMTILAPVKGKVIPLEQVPDEVFAQKVLGDGVAIIPEEGKIYSPVDGTITTITDSLHAYGFETEDGIQMIVHFGLETVNLKGKGFVSKVKVGDKVKAGDLVAEVDLDYLKNNHVETITPVIVCGGVEYDELMFQYGETNAKEVLIRSKEPQAPPEAAKEKIPLGTMMNLASQASEARQNGAKESVFSFEKALKEPGMSFICEVKKASPSKGLIAPDFPYVDIARDYEAAGAAAISVLTEPEYFLGSSDYLREIRGHVSVPLLRKDFTIDPYQIFEAKVIGASAVLLICALLDTETLRTGIHLCDSLGMSALVEAHDEEEIKSALRAGARIIGVNNRNLKTFEVDFSNSIRLRNLVPEGVLFIAESGVKSAEDIRLLHNAGVDGVLIGETLMRSGSKKLILDSWKQACE